MRMGRAKARRECKHLHGLSTDTSQLGALGPIQANINIQKV